MSIYSGTRRWYGRLCQTCERARVPHHPKELYSSIIEPRQSRRPCTNQHVVHVQHYTTRTLFGRFIFFDDLEDQRPEIDCDLIDKKAGRTVVMCSTVERSWLLEVSFLRVGRPCLDFDRIRGAICILVHKSTLILDYTYVLCLLVFVRGVVEGA